MLIWIFGLLDLFALFTLVVTHYGWIVSPLLIILTFLYLVGKGLIFFGELLSMLDVVIAFYFILFAFGITFNLLFYFGVVILLYKIIMSFTL
tara:strand:+ start:271 stop:546 length:276 start_codon:yes stop_codon:yes gene_type:complete